MAAMAASAAIATNHHEGNQTMTAAIVTLSNADLHRFAPSILPPPPGTA